MNALSYITKTGASIADCFDDLALLRIQVFRDYPYLYEGTIEYERVYLQTYASSPRALLFAVYDADQMVGATTCIPLADETDEVKEPFITNGLDLSTIFYFGESILLKPYRGQGIGHRFFDVREAHAASFKSYSTACFCSVVRPENHPLKPGNYRPNDDFWKKRGYLPDAKLTSVFDWIDTGDQAPTQKPMRYWMKTGL